MVNVLFSEEQTNSCQNIKMPLVSCFTDMELKINCKRLNLIFRCKSDNNKPTNHVTDSWVWQLTHFSWVTKVKRRYCQEQSNFRSPQSGLCKAYINLTNSYNLGKIVIRKQFLMPVFYVKYRILYNSMSEKCPFLH